jgi:hypothetical protein
LTIHEPDDKAKHIYGASTSMKTLRKGYVILDVTAHYMMTKGRQAMSFTKQFEILDLESEDFIVGTDLGPVLFPNDEIWKHSAQWAQQMTTWPTNIVRHVISRPRAAVLNATTDSDDEVDNDPSAFILTDATLPSSDEEKDEEQEEIRTSTNSSSSSLNFNSE